MGLAIGVDIVHISRIKELVSIQTSREKLFTRKELENQDPSHLAGIVAVKESFFKAIGTAPSWKDIEVQSFPNGKPYVNLSGKFEGIKSVDISISHDGDYAVAMVLIEDVKS